MPGTSLSPPVSRSGKARGAITGERQGGGDGLGDYLNIIYIFCYRRILQRWRGEGVELKIGGDPIIYVHTYTVSLILWVLHTNLL